MNHCQLSSRTSLDPDETTDARESLDKEEGIVLRGVGLGCRGISEEGEKGVLGQGGGVLCSLVVANDTDLAHEGFMSAVNGGDIVVNSEASTSERSSGALCNVCEVS